MKTELHLGHRGLGTQAARGVGSSHASQNKTSRTASFLDGPKVSYADAASSEKVRIRRDTDRLYKCRLSPQEASFLFGAVARNIQSAALSSVTNPIDAARDTLDGVLVQDSALINTGALDALEASVGKLAQDATALMEFSLPAAGGVTAQVLSAVPSDALRLSIQDPSAGPFGSVGAGLVGQVGSAKTSLLASVDSSVEFCRRGTDILSSSCDVIASMKANFSSSFSPFSLALNQTEVHVLELLFGDSGAVPLLAQQISAGNLQYASSVNPFADSVPGVANLTEYQAAVSRFELSLNALLGVEPAVRSSIRDLVGSLLDGLTKIGSLKLSRDADAASSQETVSSAVDDADGNFKDSVQSVIGSVLSFCIEFFVLAQGLVRGLRKIQEVAAKNEYKNVFGLQVAMSAAPGRIDENTPIAFEGELLPTIPVRVIPGQFCALLKTQVAVLINGGDLGQDARTRRAEGYVGLSNLLPTPLYDSVIPPHLRTLKTPKDVGDLYHEVVMHYEYLTAYYKAKPNPNPENPAYDLRFVEIINHLGKLASALGSIYDQLRTTQEPETLSVLKRMAADPETGGRCLKFHYNTYGLRNRHLFPYSHLKADFKQVTVPSQAAPAAAGSRSRVAAYQQDQGGMPTVQLSRLVGEEIV